MRAYRVFGVTFASDYPFATPLLPGEGAASFSFTCVDRAPLAAGLEERSLLYASHYRDEAGNCLWRIYRMAGCEVMCSADVAEFYLWPDRIVCHRLRPAEDREHQEADGCVIEASFLSSVLAYWLEGRGVPALHASAVALQDGAVAFLSDSGNGKSGLAAALVQARHPFLADDILALSAKDGRWLAQPGFPAMRMWPDEAEFFLGGFETLARVHPRLAKRRLPIGAGSWGAFCDAAQPLACLFVPERRDPADPRDDITLTRIAPRDAVIELVRYSFAARLVQSAGMQPRRLDLLVDISRRVPMYRLSYPYGFAHLGRVRAMVEGWADAATAGSRAAL
jgi:hypothetical protein